jgi:sulfite reductase (ferredoxin)
VGFHVRVGGGLSTKPHLAVLLPAFVHPEQVPQVVETITAIFRDSDELRVNRAKARMKFLFINHGWTAESFLAEIERRLGFKLDAPAEEHAPEGHYRDHLGIQPQKQPGLSYAGYSVVSGRISTEQLRGLATIADEFGDGSLRLSAMQNILITNVRNEHTAELVERSRALGVALDGSPFQRGTASCTGSEYCKLAITETKLFSIRLAQELEERLPGFTHTVKLHVAGCPNSCGQHPIADVGLQGVLLNQGGKQVEGFDFFVGGGLGKNSALGHRVGFRAPADEVPEALERLFTAYVAEKQEGDSVRAWTGRIGDATVKAVLGGVRPAAPVA